MAQAWKRIDLKKCNEMFMIEPAPFEARQYIETLFILIFDQLWLEAFYHLIWDTMFVENNDDTRLMLLRRHMFSWNELVDEKARCVRWASESITLMLEIIVWRSCNDSEYGSEVLTRRDLKNKATING
jgi:hypothetical protein